MDFLFNIFCIIKAWSGHGRTSQSGKFSGLNMELFVGQAIMAEQVAQNNGVHLFIVNETVIVNTFNDGFDAPVGKATTFLVDKKRLKRIQKPFGECTPDLTSINAFNTPFYRLTFEIYSHYRQTDCLNTCAQFYLIQKLKCYSASFPYLRNTSTPACLLGENLYQSLRFLSAFFIEDVSTKCVECPLECDSEYYTVTTSYLAYPTQIYARMLASQRQIMLRYNNKTPTYAQIKQSLASVSINYNQLGFTQIRELQKMTLLDLGTSIGGSIGLLLGLSCLSFVEIVELAVLLGFMCVAKLVTFSNAIKQKFSQTLKTQ